MVIPDVEWTGGDMMRLLQANGQVRLEPQQLLTGRKAVPYVKGVFGGLLKKLRTAQESPVDASLPEEQQILDCMPDVAVVVGAMELALDWPPDDNDTKLDD